ncbi:MAG: hypothetical protein ACFFA0_05340 [Promethearchaeota archaeon]
MEIKCPVWRNKYSYDREICQECEDYSIYSGAADINRKNYHNWNCSIFLEINSKAFKTSKVCELIKELSPEPNNLAIYERDFYDWNCDSNYQEYRKKEIISIPLTLEAISMNMKNKTNSHLLYE